LYQEAATLEERFFELTAQGTRDTVPA